MDELKASGKPFQITKLEVWDAWLKVKGNQGAPGADGQSIEAFEKAGRQELADKERAEREAVSGYAPTQLAEEQVDALIDEAFAETGASGPGDFGAVMGVVMGRARGQVDGATVQRKVKERLG